MSIKQGQEYMSSQLPKAPISNGLGARPILLFVLQQHKRLNSGSGKYLIEEFEGRPESTQKRLFDWSKGNREKKTSKSK